MSQVKIGKGKRMMKKEQMKENDSQKRIYERKILMKEISNERKRKGNNLPYS